MTKTKKISSTILFSILSIFLVIGSIFFFKKIENKQLLHADSTTTNFVGSNIYFPTNPFYYGYDTNWSTMTWNGLSNFNGYRVWSIGNTYYYSYNSIQYVLDTSTNTWSTMTWNGLSNFNGNNIWSIGNTYYYSSGSSTQYVLDTSTNTWSTMTWNGLSNFTGNAIWSIGNIYYYSSGSSTQYVLDTSTNTWSTMTWNGYYGLYGNNIWSIGNTYYYSGGSSTQYVLDTSTNTWSTMTWNGLSNFTGNNIWSIGNTYYYSDGSSTQYVLDTSTNTWSSMTWNGLSNFIGNAIWSIGNTYYYSNGSNQYFFVPGTPEKRTSTLIFNSVYFTFIDNGNGTFSLKNNSLFFIPTNSGNMYSISDKFVFVPTSSNLGDISSSDFIDSILLVSDSFNVNGNYYIPYSFNGTYYYMPIRPYGSNLTSLSSVNFSMVELIGDSSLSGSSYITKNSVQYSNSLNEVIGIEVQMLRLSSNAGYIVDYYGNTFPLNDILNSYNYNWLDEFTFVFKDRVYYLNSDYLNNQQYQQGFQNGKQAGYGDGFDAGYNYASDSLSQSQYNAGYSAGYSAGVVESNHYSFLGLISAVIDAPIKAFTGLFNFELLGVNIMDFITALFTLFVVIVIVKKVV